MLFLYTKATSDYIFYCLHTFRNCILAQYAAFSEIHFFTEVVLNGISSRSLKKRVRIIGNCAIRQIVWLPIRVLLNLVGSNLFLRQLFVNYKVTWQQRRRSLDNPDTSLENVARVLVHFVVRYIVGDICCFILDISWNRRSAAAWRRYILPSL